MIQTVKETVQCSKCGCIALPDATRCPKCGAAYNSNGSKETTDPMACLASPVMQDASAKVVRAYYQLTCSRHGKIHVKAAVVSSPIRCPFCQ